MERYNHNRLLRQSQWLVYRNRGHKHCHRYRSLGPSFPSRTRPADAAYPKDWTASDVHCRLRVSAPPLRGRLFSYTTLRYLTDSQIAHSLQVFYDSRP